MNITEKQEVVSQIKELIDNSNAIYVIDYNTVNVEDINNLRREFRKEGIEYKVFKNTLFKKAIDEYEGYDKFNDLLVGMSGFAFAKENTTTPAKIIKKYFTASKKFSLKGCYIEDQFFSSDHLDALSTMPTKPEIIAGIIGSIEAPISGVVGAINAVMRDLVSVIDEISKQKAA